MRSVGKRTQMASTRRRKSERKITRMVVVVVAVFVFCWLPFYALNVINLLVVLPGDFRGLYYFVVVLSYANSCANPILYGFLSDNFKRGFRKALCRTSRRVKNNDRVGTEIQRPTEEWGGILLQPKKSDAGANVRRKNCGEGGVEEGIPGVEGNSQARETCRHSNQREGLKTEAVQGANPDLSTGFHPEAAPASTSKRRNRDSQPEEVVYINSVLDISYL